MAAAIVTVVAVVLVVHLIGGLFHTHRARRHARGRRVSLYYTMGRGWYGSIRLPGGFRIGHRL